MSKIVEVKLWGTTIGYLGYSPNQTKITTFEFDDSFMSSAIQISPIKMQYPPKLHAFHDISERTFKGLPGIFADSLPDKFGNQLIDIYMAEKKISIENITALDRLLYIGTRGIGALEYHPAEKLAEEERGAVLDINMLAAARSTSL